MAIEYKEQELRELLKTIDVNYGRIEFDTTGNILDANDIFCELMGYSQDEIVGKHHRIFAEAAFAKSAEYKRFWDDLRAGRTFTNECARVTKSEEVIWIKASYMPVKNDQGKVLKVVKLCQDITMAKKAAAEASAKVEAIGRSQGTIEFNLDGTVITANENFLKVLGYSLQEISGKHHSMFVDKTYAASQEYKAFWAKLNAGQFDAGTYKRINKAGKEVWIQASYNPVMGLDGKPMKVVKFASDVTEMKFFSQLKKMIDLAPVNTMFANPEGIMLYMNEASRKTLKSIESELPDRVENFMGKSIDMFHKNPDHQKKMIKDGTKLPIKTKIHVGPHIMDLRVDSVIDIDGSYIGPMVTWSLITEKVKLVKTLEETAGQLASAAEELSATATQLTKNSESTSQQSVIAAANTEEVSKGVQVVATNTEEMVASIKEIARNSSEAANISKEAMKRAQSTNDTIGKLGTSSQEVGNVIKVISSIAQQTNLLALNATIEAARAGDAGKGFAVVANEVKELAKQTAKATEDITARIQSIQTDTGGAVESIGGISQIIEKLNGISVSIAASIEEQTATTNEVARVVKESNRGVEGIAEVVKKVSDASKQSSAGANQTLEAAKSLSKLADDLRKLVKTIEV